MIFDRRMNFFPTVLFLHKNPGQNVNTTPADQDERKGKETDAYRREILCRGDTSRL